MKKFLKGFCKVLLLLVLAVVLAVGGYLAYILIDFHRIGDNVPLDIDTNADSGEVQTWEEHKIVSWNIGFGAYESDYGFFMDGGTESRAWSRERLEQNLEEKRRNADQEIARAVQMLLEGKFPPPRKEAPEPPFGKRPAPPEAE